MGRNGQSEDQRKYAREVAVIEELQRPKGQASADGSSAQRERWKDSLLSHFVLVFIVFIYF